MVKITRAELAATAVDRWFNQYFAPRTGDWRYGDHNRVVYEKLKELNNPTPEQVNAIIGNNGWTSIACDECGEKRDCVIRLGQPPDYESATAYICGDCLKAALAIYDCSE